MAIIFSLKLELFPFLGGFPNTRPRDKKRLISECDIYITYYSMKNSSSKTDNNASTHPLHDQGPPKGEKVELRETESGQTQSEANKAQK